MTTLREDGFDDEDIIDYLIELLPIPDTLLEAKKKKEEEAPEEEDVDIDLGTDGENIDLNLDGEEGMDDTQVDMNMDTTGDIDAGSSESKKAFSELTDAYRAAKELGDEKLIRQIANTITYFNKNIILSQG
jgi:16S rRNA C1402 N4-methylase RsmH